MICRRTVYNYKQQRIMVTKFFGYYSANIVAGVGHLSTMYVFVRVCLYVSILKQKPLDIPSPNLAGG